MPRRPWKLPGFGAMLFIAWSLLSFWSCSGGGEGGVGPTAPKSPIPSLSGRYYGASKLASASGCGCVAEVAQAWLSADIEAPRGNIFREDPIYTFEWEIQQLYAAIEGPVWFVEWPKGLVGPSRCEVEGKISNLLDPDHRFSADSLQCEQDPIHLECANGRARVLDLEGFRWEGTLNTHQTGSTGEWTGTWNCFDSGNAESVGVLTLRGEWTMYHDVNIFPIN